MRQSGALSILITMALGVIALAGNQLVANTKDIVRMEQKEISNGKLLLEVRGDVKKLLERKSK